MTLPPGSRVGPYEIVSALGAGGMGEVYRARDTKLDRQVAIKILPEAFAADAERVARFQREAKTLATLNHPNIAAIYGLEDAPAEAGAHVPSGVASGFSRTIRALVMELVEGEDLAERLARGRISFDDALPMARQLADALEAAHEQGIVHRDLKPANIKVRPDGMVKVLDFGLAKALDPPASSPSVSQSPTITSPAMTAAGMILGTAAYMSPEQARGRPASTRSDIWAFGCVLYEMLTGRRAFEADELSDTLAAVLRAEPEWSALPAGTPQSVAVLVRRCLEKDPMRRPSHIAAARFALDELALSSSARAPVVVESRTPRAQIVWGLALTGALAAAGLAWYSTRAHPPALRAVRFTVAPPGDSFAGATDQVVNLAMSPDGTRLAFVAPDLGGTQLLWIRSVDALAARALQGTDGASMPFWSPDSQWLGFFADNKLKKILAAGGIPETLCEGNPRGGTWNGEGTILFTTQQVGPLSRVPAAGGVPQVVTALDQAAGERSHRWPQFLPDGRHFLYYVATDSAERSGIYVSSLDSSEKKLVMASVANARHVDPGYLLFLRGRSILAQPFDSTKLELTGDSSPVIDQVFVNVGVNVASYSAAETALAYAPGGAAPLTQLTWFDRAGRRLESTGAAGEFEQPALSPDGMRLAVVGNQPQSATRDIWVIDLARRTQTRVTQTDDASESTPVWSSDGRRVAYSSDRNGLFDVREKSIEGGPETLLLKFPGSGNLVNSATPDGRTVLLSSLSLDRAHGAANDLWLLPLSGDRAPVPFLRTPGYQGQATMSPDGVWVAYLSQASIYIRPFSNASDSTPIAVGNGSDPQWRGDGRELFYLDEHGAVMSAPVSPGLAMAVGTPRVLFQANLARRQYPNFRRFAVTPDGERFAIDTIASDAPKPALTVVLNWAAALKN